MPGSVANRRQQTKRRFRIVVAFAVALLAAGAAIAVLQADRARWHSKIVSDEKWKLTYTIAYPEGWQITATAEDPYMPDNVALCMFRPKPKHGLTLWLDRILGRKDQAGFENDFLYYIIADNVITLGSLKF